MDLRSLLWLRPFAAAGHGDARPLSRARHVGITWARDHDDLVLATTPVADVLLRDGGGPRGAIRASDAASATAAVAEPACKSQIVPLFFYLSFLDFATGLIVLRRDWSKPFALAFSGTVVLSTIWYFDHYNRAELSAAVLAATVFFAIFFTTSACTRRLATRESQPLLTFM